VRRAGDAGKARRPACELNPLTNSARLPSQQPPILGKLTPGSYPAQVKDLPSFLAQHLASGLCLGALAALLALTSCASGGDEKDDSGPDLTWKCWADTDNGTCDCRGYERNETGDRAGTNIEPVDDCSGRETCFTYYNDEFENHECECGDASFYPTREEISDVEPSTTCPPE
jgi:hypothetical protein